MNNCPIFILGCTKSGTTLLRNLFDGHKELFAIPTEIHFYQFVGKWVSYSSRRSKPERLSYKEMKLKLLSWIEYMNKKENMLSDGFTVNRWDLNEFKKELFSLDVSDEKELYELFVKALFKSLYYKPLSQNVRIVEKSIENAEFASLIKKTYPEAQFIHIVRNPYANLVAMRKFSASKQKKDFANIREPIYQMYNSFLNLYHNAEFIDGYNIVRYEDLLENPQNVMKELSKKLNIKYHDRLTVPTLLDENWDGNSTSKVKFKGINKKNAGKWKNHITPLEIKMINELFDFVLNDYEYDKIDTSESMFKYNKGEGIKNYLLNRMFWYYMPRF